MPTISVTSRPTSDVRGTIKFGRPPSATAAVLPKEPERPVFLDLETWSKVDLKRCGGRKYAADASTKIISAVALIDRHVVVWAPGMTKPKNKTCYAGGIHERRGGQKGYAQNFDVIEKFPSRVKIASRWKSLTGAARPEKPWLNGLPRLIFVSDMSDAWSKNIDFEYLRDEIIANVTSERGTRHQWLWLTKQTPRMSRFSAWLNEQGIRWPTNLWAGTSVTTEATLSRVDQLAEVGDADTIRFVSLEPQWKSIRLGSRTSLIDWLIQGGESGSDAVAFDLAWARQVRDECQAAGVKYFLKQLGQNPVERGRPLKLMDGHGGEWGEWSCDLRVREMPEVGVVAEAPATSSADVQPIVSVASGSISNVARDTESPSTVPEAVATTTSANDASIAGLPGEVIPIPEEPIMAADPLTVAILVSQTSTAPEPARVMSY